MKAILAALAFALFLAAPASADALADNTKIVHDFLDMVFNRHKVEDAFKLYVGPMYIQHNPNAADGIPGALKRLGARNIQYPDMHLDMKRFIAQGDLVVVHSHQTLMKEERGNAIMDIFRVENGKIVEHWDVVQAVPETSANPNTMF